MEKPFWEQNAEAWAHAVRSRAIASRAITGPAILAEILRRKPGNVLDLGCGEGWIASAIAPHGIDYTGWDGSAALVGLARTAHPTGEFAVMDYGSLAQGETAAPGRRFDLAVFNFALMAEDPSPTLRAARALLNPAGTLLIQTLHPCFALEPYEDGWRTEDFRTFQAPMQGTMPWYGRTLASWIELISESGYDLQRLVEPADPHIRRPLSLILAATTKKAPAAD